ncbi:hypothetical protein [Desulfovibrio piger]|uniref:hypothetical protein n=1 Tax=Desulfovibrio piger TaxID=901 RepID=UPI0026F09188|nr:hypothetical protein [Desulfovibrio piger]
MIQHGCCIGNKGSTSDAQTIRCSTKSDTSALSYAGCTSRDGKGTAGQVKLIFNRDSPPRDGRSFSRGYCHCLSLKATTLDIHIATEVITFKKSVARSLGKGSRELRRCSIEGQVAAIDQCTLARKRIVSFQPDDTGGRNLSVRTNDHSGIACYDTLDRRREVDIPLLSLNRVASILRSRSNGKIICVNNNIGNSFFITNIMRNNLTIYCKIV